MQSYSQYEAEAGCDSSLSDSKPVLPVVGVPCLPGLWVGCVGVRLMVHDYWGRMLMPWQ